MTWLIGLFSGPSKWWAYGIAAAIIFGAGSVAGFQTRDYFAERKATKELEQKLKAQTELTVKWAVEARDYQARVDAQNARTAELVAQRDASLSRAQLLAQQAQSYKVLLTKLEKPDVENGGMCERTTECHWLFLNAAYSGTAAPAQCAGGVPN